MSALRAATSDALAICGLSAVTVGAYLLLGSALFWLVGGLAALGIAGALQQEAQS